jgi:hypothetical protein
VSETKEKRLVQLSSPSCGLRLVSQFGDCLVTSWPSLFRSSRAVLAHLVSGQDAGRQSVSSSGLQAPPFGVLSTIRTASMCLCLMHNFGKCCQCVQQIVEQCHGTSLQVAQSHGKEFIVACLSALKKMQTKIGSKSNLVHML